MTETFKIIHGHYDHKIVCSLSKLYESAGTRGHPFKLHKKTILTNQYAHFFFTDSYKQLEQLALMPSNTVLAGTLNSFKILLVLDKHRKQYIWHKVNDENKPGQFMQHS